MQPVMPSACCDQNRHTVSGSCTLLEDSCLGIFQRLLLRLLSETHTILQLASAKRTQSALSFGCECLIVKASVMVLVLCDVIGS
jgi:hypothetical protein